MSLVNDIVSKLVELRPLYPSRNMTREQLGEYLNEVAYAFKDSNVGLQRKLSGDVAIMPDANRTTISHDTIRIGNTGGDFLVDAEGVAGPQTPEMFPADPATFVSPIKPPSRHEEPAPGPVPSPVPLPFPAPEPDIDLSALIGPAMAELEAVREAIVGLKASIDALNQHGLKIHF